MNCVATDCFTPRAFGFFFCRKCWRKLPETIRTHIHDAWEWTGRGDAAARRCLGPAVRDGVRYLEVA